MQKIAIKPKPSKLLFIFLSCLHVLAVLALILAAIPWWFKAGGLVFLILSAFITISKTVFFKGKKNIKSCEVEDNQWQLLLSNNESIAALLQPSSFISQWLIILNFKTEGYGRKVMLLASDSISPDLYRELRLTLA